MFSFRGFTRVNNSMNKLMNVRNYIDITKTQTPKKTPKKYILEAEKIVISQQANIPQSPLKMKFLVMLARNAWVPDAMAQLRFSPKHRAVDVGKIIKRASAISKIHFNAIPEELMVKEIMVTKGTARKKVRVMGRGRAGIGMIRSSHVTVKLQVIDFAQKIQEAKTPGQKRLWEKRQDLVLKLKEANAPTVTTPTPTVA